MMVKQGAAAADINVVILAFFLSYSVTFPMLIDSNRRTLLND